MSQVNDGNGAEAEATPVRGHRASHGEALLDRAFRVLGCFGPDTPVLSLTSLAARSELPKATALRIARKLVEKGALERTDSGQYTIGLRLLEIAALAPRGHGLRAIALPYMQDLLHATRQHVALVVREHLDGVLIERLTSHHAEPVAYRVGGRMPLRTTAPGLVLLAFAPAHVQDDVLGGDSHADGADTGGPNGDGDALRSRLAAVRRDRYAVYSRRHCAFPTTAIAAPIFDRHQNVIAAVSILTSSERTEPSAHIPAVVAVTRAISRTMAYDT